MPDRRQRGFTLVELLVVIAIIGILVSLLLPAVQAAREAGRRTQCSNHLKQLSLGMLSHVTGHGKFPSGGWGWYMVADADRGTGPQQPGGWYYAVLPYLEQEALYVLGAGTSGAAKLTANAQRCQTPVPAFNCPTRRPAQLFAAPVWNHAYNADAVAQCVRGDYAASAGDVYQPWDMQGPQSISDGDTMTANNSWPNVAASATGICYLRSEVTPAHVADGLSNTYLIGEKYLGIDYYLSGTGNADNETIYAGYDNDNHRSTNLSWPPLQDQPNLDDSYRFGSAHAGSFNMSFGDGSVRGISYSIDPEVHRRLGNRKDGLPVDASKF